MSEFCVFIYDKKIQLYYVYYHHLELYVETNETPNNCDNFEYSRLTKRTIQSKSEEGITIQNLLVEYANNLNEWRNELLNSKKLIKPYDHFATFQKSDGTKFINTNESNILRFFNGYSSKIYTNDKFEKIEWKEYEFFEKENLASLQRCISGKYNCLGYDFKMAYPNYLSSRVKINGVRQLFHFPIKAGCRYKLKVLKDELKYGLYRVKIHTDNKDFQFIFNFSSEHVYTHTEIYFCRKYQEQYNISIELIIDGDFNALLYDSDKLIDGDKVFGMWLDRIQDLKEENPKNGLVKLLSSSIWGYLSKKNGRYYNEKELNEKPEIKFDYYDSENINYICLDEKDRKDGTTDYFLVDKSQPYCKNYRLKPFLKSFERVIMAEICIYIGINKIVRINTDNITFNTDLLSDDDITKIKNISPTFIQESKTTTEPDEIMIIKNVNDMVKCKK